MTTVAQEIAISYFRAIGWLAKNRCWLFHKQEGWQFDAWTTQTMHGVGRRVAVLAPDFTVGTARVYLATYHPGLFKGAAKAPAPLHAPLEVPITMQWRATARTLDEELLALVGIEKATGLSRQAA